MKFKLRKIEINNFLSFKNEIFSNIKNYNVLIGKNNVGKSNLFKIFEEIKKSFKGELFEPSILFDEDQDINAHFSLTFELSTKYREEFFENINKTNYFNGVFREDNKPKRVFESYNKKTLNWLIHQGYLNAIKITIAYNKHWKCLILKEISIISKVIKIPKPIFETKLTAYNLQCFMITPGSLVNKSSFKEFFDFKIDNISNLPYSHKNLRDSLDYLYRNKDISEIVIIKKIFEDFLIPFPELITYIPANRRFDDFSKITGDAFINLAQDGHNIGQFIYIQENNAKEWMTEFNDVLRPYFPNLKRLSQNVKGENTIPHYEEKELNMKIKFNNKGSGIMQIAFILMGLKKLEKDKILLIEEPELFIFPGLQKQLRNTFLELSDKFQIFISTHSPIFLSRDLEISSIFQIQKEELVSKNKIISDKRFLEVFKDLNLNPYDYLLYDGILFVEGLKDIEVFEEFINAFFKSQIKCIDMVGKRNISYYADARILDLLTDYSINHVFLLDKSTDSEKVLKNLESPDRKIEIIKLFSYEIENLFLQLILLMDFLYNNSKSVNLKEDCKWLFDSISNLFKESDTKYGYILKKINQDYLLDLSENQIKDILNSTKYDKDKNEIFYNWKEKICKLLENKKRFYFFKNFEDMKILKELKKIDEYYEDKFKNEGYNEIIPGKEIWNQLKNEIQRKFRLSKAVSEKKLTKHLINFLLTFYKYGPKIDKYSGKIGDLGGVVSHVEETNIKCLKDDSITKFQSYCQSIISLIKQIKEKLNCKLKSDLQEINLKDFDFSYLKNFLIYRWGLGQKFS